MKPTVSMAVDKNHRPSFEFWAILEDGELDDAMYGIGVINGLHYDQLGDILDELKDSILDLKDKYPANCSIKFLATDVYYNEGQMSLPETGQWDFTPYYEMNIKPVEVDVF